MKTKMTQAEMHEAWKKRNEKKQSNPTPVLTPEKYEELKVANQSDNKIMADYGFYASKFHAWKKEHNLIGKHNLKTIQKEQSEVVEVKSTTNQPDTKNFAQAITDTSKLEQQIEHLTKVNERQLVDNQKLAAENTKLHKGMREQIVSDHPFVRQIKSSLENAEEKYKAEHKKRVENLKQHALLENQLTNATERIQQLKQIESDYMQLERDYLNERNEKERMSRMLDRLKRTEQINVWLMEQHVAFHAQLDEVTA